MLIIPQVRNVTGMSVPKVYAWNASKTGNPVGAEYIIMEKAKGTVLSSKWPTMSPKEKLKLVQNVVKFESSLFSHRFDSIGSLYYEADLAKSQRSNYFVTSFAGFVMGPTTSRASLIDGRRHVDFDRGPC